MDNLWEKSWHMVATVCHVVLKAVFKFMNKELTDNVYETFMQFIKFGIVGLSNTGISYLIYAGSLIWFRHLNMFSESDYLIAQFVAFILSVLWSFYWNNKVVFVIEKEKKRSFWKVLVKTYISYSFTGLFLNSILLVFWVKICHISELVAPIINLLVSVPLNFVINKYWAFGQKT